MALRTGSGRTARMTRVTLRRRLRTVRLGRGGGAVLGVLLLMAAGLSLGLKPNMYQTPRYARI